MYPKEFRGQIDHWGNYKVRISKRGFALFKTTPQKFEVLIEDNGRIQFTTTERGWDLTRGSKTIGRLFANHFGKNEFKKNQFEANKKKLFVVINKLKEEFHLYLG